MLHIDPKDTTTIKRLDAGAIHGVRAYAKPVEDGGRSFLMLLIEYPKDNTDRLMSSLHYKR